MRTLVEFDAFLLNMILYDCALHILSTAFTRFPRAFLAARTRWWSRISRSNCVNAQWKQRAALRRFYETVAWGLCCCRNWEWAVSPPAICVLKPRGLGGLLFSRWPEGFADHCRLKCRLKKIADSVIYVIFDTEDSKFQSQV